MKYTNALTQLRHRIALAATLGAICAGCGEPQVVINEEVTGLDIRVSYAADLSLDQLNIGAWLPSGTVAFEAFRLPETPLLLEGTEQSFVVLLPDELAQQSIRLEISGLAAGNVLAFARGEVEILSKTLTRVEVALRTENICETDEDHDGICDDVDNCIDRDGDGFGSPGTVTDDCPQTPVDRNDLNPSLCSDLDEDSCDDCSQGGFDPQNDGADGDDDGICDQGDPCTDRDGDGFGTGTLDNDACDHRETDVDDNNANRCIDLDSDGCDDCSLGSFSPDHDGDDSDRDGQCDLTDTCTDSDGDGIGNGTQGNSGCVSPMTDSDDANPSVCGDADSDTCDDCSSGTWNTRDDGVDQDFDSICDAADLCTDFDGDGLGTGTAGNIGCETTANDTDDSNPYICADLDSDSCEDCTTGSFNPGDDGDDSDDDGMCDRGDPCTDFDGDGLGTGTMNNVGCEKSTTDSDDHQSTVCADTDDDACDDCTTGFFNPQNDGSDLDGDGLCDVTDRCADNDGDGFGNGSFSNETCPESLTDVDDGNANACADTDGDHCDDCTHGIFSTSFDGPDGDADGICDETDTCTDADGDGVGNGNLDNVDCETQLTDRDDSDRYSCRDSDHDSCDDCSNGSWNPASDGPDRDSDSICDHGDACSDRDGDGFGHGSLNTSGCEFDAADVNDDDAAACTDTDNDFCDDCSTGSFDPNNDGADTDSDGKCNAGDTCTDSDHDGLGNGTLNNTGCPHVLTDINDYNDTVCGDTDDDSCDDCATGEWNPANDGPDDDGDGICNEGETCVDNDGDSVCEEIDCDDANPFCGTDCTDNDDDGYCAGYDCNESISECHLDCTTNSDADSEQLPVADCVEIYCGSDPFDGNSSCSMPTSADELAATLERSNAGTTHILIGDITVDDNLPTIGDRGPVSIRQQPGTTITTSAERLFHITNNDNDIEGLVIEVEDGATIFDIDGDGNKIIDVTILTTDDAPERVFEISGTRNLVADSRILGFEQRGISISGSQADHNVISNNVITGGSSAPSNSTGGIFIWSASNTTLVGNVIAKNAMEGIVMRRATNTMIAHNTIADNINGIAFAGWSNSSRSYNTCIRNNAITGSQWAGVTKRTSTTWDTSPGCAAQNDNGNRYGNNHYDNANACDPATCGSCSCLPSGQWWEYEYDPDYATTDLFEPGFYCLGESQLEDLGRNLGYDLNGPDPEHYVGTAPDIGGRESGSSECE